MQPTETKKDVPAAQVFPAHWLPLSTELRAYLAKVFDIKKTSFSEIVNNNVISDGFTPKDLSGITIEKMQVYVNDPKEKDFYRLWEICISKAKSELNPPKDIVVPSVENSVETVEKPKKTGLEPIDPKKADLANTLMGKENANVKGTKKK